MSEKTERKSLKVIQPSASEGNALVGNKRPLPETGQKKRKLSSSITQKKRRISSKVTGPLVIYSDPECSSKLSDETKEANNLEYVPDDTEHIKVLREPESDLTTDEPSIDYWKMLAETRREALENTLKENEQLHNRVNELTDRVEELEQEAVKYEELAEKAEYLADTIKFLTEADVPESSFDKTNDSDGDG